jgi:hypothetical protein
MHKEKSHLFRNFMFWIFAVTCPAACGSSTRLFIEGVRRGLGPMCNAVHNNK